MVRYVLLFALVAFVTTCTALTKPTAAQIRMMDMGLSQFMHFSVDPFTSIEHNCVGTSSDCIPASTFNPTNLSTDQWVETAVAFGAEEICLTAHHEGGFCLWDTKYSNYSVMHSPYGKDVVKQFVASCQKYGVKPCYYMGPNANGWLSNHQNYTAEAFVVAQLGMLKELLTGYGTDIVSRLWWDHYPGSCGGLAPCPNGSFPAAWPRFVNLVREVSPSTIICPGPDCDGHQGESGIGNYPAWFPCDPKVTNGTELSCGGHSPSAAHTGFHPYESCATMHNGWFCKGNGSTAGNTYWSPREIWDHYMSSVGIGYVNTLNAPPGTTGQIPEPLVKNMVAFGTALRKLLKPVSPSATAGLTDIQCSNSSTEVGLEIDFGSETTFNAMMLREDLTDGQRIMAYSIDYYEDSSNTWKAFTKCAGTGCTPGKKPTKPIPHVDRGECSPPVTALNLVSGGADCKVVNGVASANDCQQLCDKDTSCNFFTWHTPDVQPASYAKKCYLRQDNTYAPKSEASHVSGICNHTLTPANNHGGIHGLSVGARLIDFVPKTTTSKIRFRCTASIATDGTARLRSFSAHDGEAPPDSA